MSKKHGCNLNKDPDSNLQILLPDASFGERLRHTFQKICVASKCHPEVRKYLKSDQAICRENKKLLAVKSKFLIHPLSLFRKYWDIVIFFALMNHVFLTAFYLGFYPHLKKKSGTILEIDSVLCVLLFLEVYLKFRTGIIVKQTHEIELNPQVIAKTYLKRCIVDVIGSFPTVEVANFCGLEKYTESGTDHWYIFVFVTGLIYIFHVYRLWSVSEYFNSLTANFKWSEKKTIVLGLIFKTFWLWHLTACYRILFQIPPKPKIETFDFPEAEKEFTELYNVTLKRMLLKDLPKINIPRIPELKVESTLRRKYIGSLLITIKVAMQSGYSVATSDSSYNMLMTIMIMIFGWIYFTYVLIIVMNLVKSSEISKTKFEEMSSGIQSFCENKHLSKKLREKMMKNHRYKFKGHYFNEARIDSYTPENLKKELLKYSCASLLTRNSLLTKITDTIFDNIMKYLKLDIYFENDVVFTAGSTGDCMFFLLYGTLAVYSPEGYEIAHLSDGSYFGEIVLLKPGQRHRVTIVALETCEIYRLNRDDFNYVIKPHSDLWHQMNATAEGKMEI